MVRLDAGQGREAEAAYREAVARGAEPGEIWLQLGHLHKLGGRWQEAIVRYLSSIYPGLAQAVVASAFNSALSVRQYLNAPDGAVYGFAPSPNAADRSPRTVVPGLYLSSAYAGFGGYTCVIQSAGVCADMVLGENK